MIAWSVTAWIVRNPSPRSRDLEADMPLTTKGKKIKAAMAKQYGKERGERVFYAAENKGTIKGVAKKGKKK
jgi:hypothetical protein